MNLNANIKKQNIPVKRTINLVIEEKKGLESRFGLIVAIIFLLSAVLVGKFGIVDRNKELEAKKLEVIEAKTLLDAMYEEYKAYGDIDSEYAHYTYKDFSEEELMRADRVDTLNLINNHVLSRSTINAFSLSQNRLELSTGEITLRKAKEIVASLESDPLVDFCTIRSAQTGSDIQYDDDAQIINAEISVYLKLAEVER